MDSSGAVAPFSGMESRFVGDERNRIGRVNGNFFFSDDVARICVQAAGNVKGQYRTFECIDDFDQFLPVACQGFFQSDAEHAIDNERPFF